MSECGRGWGYGRCCGGSIIQCAQVPLGHPTAAGDHRLVLRALCRAFVPSTSPPSNNKHNMQEAQQYAKNTHPANQSTKKLNIHQEHKKKSQKESKPTTTKNVFLICSFVFFFFLLSFHWSWRLVFIIHTSSFHIFPYIFSRFFLYCPPTHDDPNRLCSKPNG